MFYMKIGDKETAEEFQGKATRIGIEKQMAEARASGKTATGGGEAERIQKLEERIEKFKAIIEMDPEEIAAVTSPSSSSADLIVPLILLALIFAALGSSSAAAGGGGGGK